MGRNYIVETLPNGKKIAVMSDPPEDSKENEDWIRKARARRKRRRRQKASVK